MDVCFTRYNKAHLAQSDTALFLEENLAMSLRTLCGQSGIPPRQYPHPSAAPCMKLRWPRLHSSYPGSDGTSDANQ